MNMISSIDPVVTVLILANVLLLGLMFWSFRRRIYVLECFKDALIAHAKAKPTLAEKVLVDTWKTRYAELTDCPKRAAYRNRLIEVGAMGKDGKYLDGTPDVHVEESNGD